MILLVGPVHTKDLLHRLNYGTVFQEEPTLFATSEYWTHTFVLDLKGPTMPLFQIPTCSCPSLLPVFHKLASLQNETLNIRNKTISDMLNMLKSPKHRPRSRRALLPFLGNIAKGLIGVSTSEDLDRVANRVNILQKQNAQISKKFNHEISLMTSFMGTANSRLDNAFESIETNHNLIRQFNYNLNTSITAVETKQAWLFAILIEQLNYHMTIQNQYHQLYFGFTSLLQGNLSPIIIPHTELNKVIRQIHTLLFIHRPGFHLLHNAPSYFYKNADFKIHKSEKAVLIAVKFPLGSHDQPMKLFKILHYPVPINTSSPHATQISDLPSYLAISHLRDSYTTLPENALNSCSKDKSSLNCHFTVPMYSLENPNCALALYQGNKSDIHNLCNFRLAQDNIPHTIRQLNESHFLMVNISIITLACPLKTHILNGCSFCVIQVPCNCSISTKDLTLPKRHPKCHTINNNVTVMHPVNLILLHKFFGLNAISNITADTTFPTPLNISVKPFRYYNHTFSKLIANDNRAHLSLDRVIARAKEDKLIYQELAEPLLTSNDFYNSSETALYAISIVSLVSSILSFSTLIYMCRKYRKIIALITISQKLGQSSAYPTNLPSFIYTDIPTTTAPYTLEDIHIHIHNYSAYVILTIALVAFCIFLYKRLYCYHRPALMIDITNGKQCVTCFIMHLPLCIQSCHFHATLPYKIIDVQNIICPSLTFNWGNLQIITTNDYSSLSLPSTIRISPWNAYKIRRAISGTSPVMIQLWACHHKFSMPINICSTDCGLTSPEKSVE